MSAQPTDAIKDAAAQVILSALHAAQQTGEWMKGQIPDVLRQLLRWEITHDLMWIALFAVWIFATRRYLRSFAKQYKAAKADYTGLYPFDITDMPLGGLHLFATVVVTLAFVGLLVCAVYSTFDLVEVLVAPKVWILEYARGLL